MEKISIIDNFLAEEEFVTLRDSIIHSDFQWFFKPTIVYEDEEQTICPGQFIHIVYRQNIPYSEFYHSSNLVHTILKRSNADILSRIQISCLLRLPEPFVSSFHIDKIGLDNIRWTTSIFYINTNNGYTEFEDGTKAEVLQID